MRIFLLCISAILFVGCQQSQKTFNTSEDDQLDSLQERLTKANDRIEHLQEKNSILESLVQGEGVPGGQKSFVKRMHRPVMKKRRSNVYQKSPLQQQVNVPRGSEKEIYQFILNAYQRKLRPQLVAAITVLEKDYANSSYLDNAYYLQGKLELDKKMFGASLRSFNEVIKKFPLGNKRSSAIYGKAQTYLKMKLPKMAVEVLRQVVKEYPNSLEAKRAKIDIRLLKKSKA